MLFCILRLSIFLLEFYNCPIFYALTSLDLNLVSHVFLQSCNLVILSDYQLAYLGACFFYIFLIKAFNLKDVPKKSKNSCSLYFCISQDPCFVIDGQHEHFGNWDIVSPKFVPTNIPGKRFYQNCDQRENDQIGWTCSPPPRSKSVTGDSNNTSQVNLWIYAHRRIWLT